jgi:hypothetical protein
MVTVLLDKNTTSTVRSFAIANWLLADVSGCITTASAAWFFGAVQWQQWQQNKAMVENGSENNSNRRTGRRRATT